MRFALSALLVATVALSDAQSVGNRGPVPLPKNFVTRASAYLDAAAKADRLSGTALIAIDGKVVLRKAYGFADWATKRPMTPETAVPLFSISKSFTAGAILLLQDRGLLQVGDAASKYLTDLPAEWHDITIHQLLTHTSGIGGKVAESWFTRVVGEAASELGAANDAQPSKPGERYEYSNLGYVILGQIVAKVSGMPFERFVQSAILTPLEMTGAGFGGHWEGQLQVARGHSVFGGRLMPFDQRLSIIPGAGSLHANVDDMLKWRQAIDRGTLFSAKAREALHTPWVTIDPETKYGYGWVYHTEWPMWEHSGSGASCVTSVIWLPDRKMTIIVLKNSDSTAGDLPSWDLASLAYGHHIAIPRFASLDFLDRCQGVYLDRKGNQIVVRLAAGVLTVYLPRKAPQLMEYAGGKKFQGGGIVAAFEPRPDGLFDLRLTLNGKEVRTARRASQSNLDDYVGAYGDTEGTTSIEHRGRWLVAPMLEKNVSLDPFLFVLLPAGKDRFLAPIPGTEVRFARDAKGRVTSVKTMVGSRVVSTATRRKQAR